MAGAEDGEEEFGNTDSWRILLLFLLIIIIDFIWELIDHHVTHWLASKQSKGLMHAWEKLKFEIMALGIISLLLVVFEEYLLKICIDEDDGGAVTYYKRTTTGETDAALTHNRHMLAGGVSHSCPDGKEPLWSSKLIHKLHLFIFLIAVAHVLYAVLCLTLSIWSLRRWRKFEAVAAEGELLPLPTSQLRKEGESSFVFGVRQCVRQFTHPIDVGTYVALRCMFFEQMQLEYEFNFADFVADFLTEEFSKIIQLELLMWLLAALWIIVPAGAYAALWTTGIFLLLSLIAGAKLHTVAADLALRAYSLYYRQDLSVDPTDAAMSPKGGSSSPSSTLSVGDVSGAGVSLAGKAGLGAQPLGEGVESAVAQRDAPSAPVYGATPGGSGSPSQGQAHLSSSAAVLPSIREHTSDDLGSRRAAGESLRLPSLDVVVAQDVRVPSPADAGAANGSTQAALVTSGRIVTFQHGSSSAPAAPDVRAVQTSQTDDADDHVAAAGWRCCAACGRPERRAAEESAPTHRKRMARRLRGDSTRRVKAWRGDREFIDLFWFKRPRLMLRIFQYTYFENALSLAVLVFAIWQHESALFDGAVGSSQGTFKWNAIFVSVVLIAVDTLLLVHSTLFVLPVYALTAASANFGNPESLLDFAKKRGIRPHMVHFLQNGEDAAAAPQVPQVEPPSPARVPPTADAGGASGDDGCSAGPDSVAGASPSAQEAALHTSSAHAQPSGGLSRHSVGAAALAPLRQAANVASRLGLARASCPAPQPSATEMSHESAPGASKPKASLRRQSTKVAHPTRRPVLARSSAAMPGAAAMPQATGAEGAAAAAATTIAAPSQAARRTSLTRKSCPERSSADLEAGDDARRGVAPPSRMHAPPHRPSDQTSLARHSMPVAPGNELKRKSGSRLGRRSVARGTSMQSAISAVEAPVRDARYEGPRYEGPSPAIASLVQSMFRARLNQMEDDAASSQSGLSPRSTATMDAVAAGGPGRGGRGLARASAAGALARTSQPMQRDASLPRAASDQNVTSSRELH